MFIIETISNLFRHSRSKLLDTYPFKVVIPPEAMDRSYRTIIRSNGRVQQTQRTFVTQRRRLLCSAATRLLCRDRYLSNDNLEIIEHIIHLSKIPANFRSVSGRQFS